MSHPHAHGRDADSNRDHDHDHGDSGSGPVPWLRHLLRPHSHEEADQVDAVMEASAEGMRVLWISLGILGVTALAQLVVTVLSGSVALLGDTLHNAADALTALPLGVAFVVGRRPPTRRYTYGYGRAEDLAGIVIVVMIAASSALAAYEAVTRLLHPHRVTDLIAVAAAALVGFAGNELAARYRIRTGRKIGSAALVADGLHARTDGFTSLAVLLGAGGVALGWDWADPAVGLLITVAILAVLRQTAREIYRRLMDAVDPALVDQADSTLHATPGVLGGGRSGCAGSATRSAPSARSSSTRISQQPRPTRSRSAPSTPFCTRSPGCPPRSSTPTPLRAAATRTASWPIIARSRFPADPSPIRKSP
jgi:cation diffusion facilitator family transporter